MDSEVGVACIFIAATSTANKPAAERRARGEMAKIASDEKWNASDAVKTLTLEHHMAAARRGFLPMFQALDGGSRLGTGLRKGELAGLRLFTERVEPLLSAAQAGDRFAVMTHLRKISPLLKRRALETSAAPDDPLGSVRTAVDDLLVISSGANARFLDVLQCIARHGLSEIPAGLRPFTNPEPTEEPTSDKTDTFQEDEDDAEASPSSLKAWRAFLETPYHQIKLYSEYVKDKGPFGTHQGVKGLEFDRVPVILDDREARGFMFSYDKLFGVKPTTEKSGSSESGIGRTRRLLYVTCTRAQKGLALVVYTENSDLLALALQRQGWFRPDEIIRL